MRDKPRQLIYGFDKFYLVGPQPADLDWIVWRTNFAHWPLHLWRSGCAGKITLHRRGPFGEKLFLTERL